ncbi:Ribosomal protein L22e family-containing protein [Strongyloides ratti]|uniref:Large ribosomal subunit protein eL22 n=1 Tax=Strongyloides ratti TaxID=34506 RepID=A0A090LF47_STRRB|nr:Ribosomal protein L22e family-containing protein [Strongyloides ratti]CEF66743.1 Ribosomal protein L22e family-containing protein [Strongyloides ratti]
MAPAVKKTAKRQAVKRVSKKKQTYKFTIDCKNPVEDGILKTANFEEYLQKAIKYKGKTGQLEVGGIKVEATKNSITVTSEKEFSKRYLKYLTKKYLKKHSLRDWLRVIASNKNTYELKYFQINNEDDEESGDEN